MEPNKIYSFQSFEKICRLCMRDYKGKKNNFKKLLANKTLCKQFHEVFGQTVSKITSFAKKQQQKIIIPLFTVVYGPESSANRLLTMCQSIA
jgi:hypothetical protein